MFNTHDPFGSDEEFAAYLKQTRRLERIVAIGLGTIIIGIILMWIFNV